MSMFATLMPGVMDMATQAAMPLLAMPLDGMFEPLARHGRRILAAQDGMYLEAFSDALYVRLRLSQHSLPYGNVSPEIVLANGPIPRELARQLKALSLEAHPNEMAALVLADAAGGYSILKPEGSATHGSVSYADTGYDESKLVIDAHSHGHFGPAFSPTDDDSDRSRIGPHISLVFGHCASREGCEIAVRVCVGRYLIPISNAVLEGLFA